MRTQILVFVLLAIYPLTSAAQSADKERPTASTGQQDPTSDAANAETKARIEAGRKRQEAANARTMGLWTRWIYAVCIGCGAGEPRKIRIVHTTPARVLAGIPAADDDAREQAMASRYRGGRRIGRV
jgi:hypothetical protein